MEQGGHHPAWQDLESFMQGELRGTEAREVVGHLLTSCPLCLEVTRRLWWPEQPAYTLDEVPGDETRPIRLAVSVRGRLLKFNGR
jgi:hypothetical protein